MAYYDGALEGLFALLDRRRILRADEPVLKSSPVRKPPGELFEPSCGGAYGGSDAGAGDIPGRNTGPECPAVRFDRRGRNRSLIDFWEGRFPGTKPPAAGTAQEPPSSASVLPAAVDLRAVSMAAELFELSAEAYYHFVACWMSGLPMETELVRFARRVMAAAEGKGGTGEDRAAADRICRDRNDPAVEKILTVSARVRREIHRLMGFLRFAPAEQDGKAGPRRSSGLHLARCAPDYFILPALAEHFRLRFGAAPWLIIDEKRRLVLACNGAAPELERYGSPWTALNADPVELSAGQAGPDGDGNVSGVWEDLWRNYHRSINNEARENPRLQRQFMPVRYRKYLPECDE
jgi:probable DNA metabolism protein